MRVLKHALLGSALAVVGVAQAGLIVDTFDTPVGGVTTSIIHPTGALSVTQGPTSGGSILGARNLTYSITSAGPTVDGITINIAPYGSYLVETADNNGSPNLTFDYTGFTASVADNTLLLHGYNTDANLERVQATFFDGAAGVSSSGWVAVAASHSGDLVLGLVGTADLTDITHIRLEIQGDPGADFTLGSIIAAPEPSTYGALTALGLLGTVIWRRARS